LGLSAVRAGGASGARTGGAPGRRCARAAAERLHVLDDDVRVDRARWLGPPCRRRAPPPLFRVGRSLVCPGEGRGGLWR